MSSIMETTVGLQAGAERSKSETGHWPGAAGILSLETLMMVSRQGQ